MFEHCRGVLWLTTLLTAMMNWKSWWKQQWVAINYRYLKETTILNKPYIEKVGTVDDKTKQS